jgi:hypothetical protein
MFNQGQAGDFSRSTPLGNQLSSSSLSFQVAAVIPKQELAPGSVSVESLDGAQLILDPAIHFVRITRPNWIATIGRDIAKTLGAPMSVMSMEKRNFESCWQDSDPASALPNWSRDMFPQSSSVRIAWDALAQDALLLRETLISLTQCTVAHSNIRLELKNCAPGMHLDAQAITIGAAYVGGGTVVRLQDGQLIQLKTGEIGIWKGEMFDVTVYCPDTDAVLHEGTELPINSGQGLLHSATQNPADYPRLMGLHDIRDAILPQVVRNALRPWAAEQEE